MKCDEMRRPVRYGSEQKT